jgi:predicted nucleotidyltransferase
MGPGHLLSRTRLSDLDCLGTIDGGRSHEDLVERTVVLDFDGRAVRVIQLEELVEIKRRAGRPKDLAAIPYLEATIRAIARTS